VLEFGSDSIRDSYDVVVVLANENITLVDDRQTLATHEHGPGTMSKQNF
jgi:hypothetical protein